jgi:hypothetical protein
MCTKTCSYKISEEVGITHCKATCEGSKIPYQLLLSNPATHALCVTIGDCRNFNAYTDSNVCYNRCPGTKVGDARTGSATIWTCITNAACIGSNFVSRAGLAATCVTACPSEAPIATSTKVCVNFCPDG